MSLGLGQEKAAISVFIQKTVHENNLAANAHSVAAILGVGTGWELKLLKQLGFASVIGYEPALPMLHQAKQLVASLDLTGVELYDNNGLEAMRKNWRHHVNFVLGTHVIPALERRDILHDHFTEYHTFLSANGMGLAITNNPQDQFFNHPTYSCNHLGPSVNDGDRIYTHLKEIVFTEQSDTLSPLATESGQFIVEDIFWSDDLIRSMIRKSGLTLNALHYIQLIGRDDLVAPYVAYACRRPK